MEDAEVLEPFAFVDVVRGLQCLEFAMRQTLLRQRQILVRPIQVVTVLVFDLFLIDRFKVASLQFQFNGSTVQKVWSGRETGIGGDEGFPAGEKVFGPSPESVRR